jgi:hypothetical protein
VTVDSGFLRPMAFSTCCYMKKHPGERAKMVFEAISSWKELLDLAFAEKIFLDDRSPEFSGLRLLTSTQLLDKFTRAEYCTIDHPPHSNFGIVRSLELTSAPYIMHLDDDVHVKGTPNDCKRLIDLAIDVMERDSTIMGFNLLNLDPSFHGEQWLPGEPYQERAGLHHPTRYFGTAACVIRRTLLERVPFSQLQLWGTLQPGVWEALVTDDTRQFITVLHGSPFSVKKTSYFFNATSEISTRVRYQYILKSKLKSLIARK